ncbi:MAG: hypothetical protein NC319_04545 [Butyricicoccus sp.]|nr:hypothetical protein [Butyricicoccus sp.]MCM1232983.1 hypothetical protein [Ruminococcus flavefaciens]
MSNSLAGGWKLEHMKPCDLPQQAATGFSAVAGSPIVGARYVPVLYVGTQIVAGTNYMILCEQTMSTLGQERHLVKMVINQSPENQWSLVSIERIV